MSDVKRWISIGFEKGDSAREAVESRGYTITGESVDGNITTFTTSAGTLQTLDCQDGRFLGFRLVEEGVDKLAEYVPSGKPPRKPRPDRGKSRKKKEGE